MGGVSPRRGQRHPHHHTIVEFGRRLLKKIETLFLQVLAVAHELGVVRLRTVAQDGTKIHAHPGRASALW